jgi:hypothetical protein
MRSKAINWMSTRSHSAPTTWLDRLLGVGPAVMEGRHHGRDREYASYVGLGLLLPADVLRHHRFDRLGGAGRTDQAEQPFLVFVVVLTALIYPIQASRGAWGGGFLDAAGFSDFAGSTIVHSVGGWAALVGAIILGPRIGKYGKDGKVNPIPGSNLALATLGVFILWMGWFGFNGASAAGDGHGRCDVANVSRVFANTNMAAASGAVAALILTQVLFKKGRPDADPERRAGRSGRDHRRTAGTPGWAWRV